MKSLIGLCCLVCVSFFEVEDSTDQVEQKASAKEKVACKANLNGCDPSSCSTKVVDKKSSNCTTSKSCSVPATQAKSEFTEMEKKAIQYISDVVQKEKRVAFEQGEVEKAIGGELPESSPGHIQAGVLAELDRRGFDMGSLPASRCAKYNACSVNMDLSYAEGPELALYEREKKLDGKKVEAYLPQDFTLLSTKGNQVQLSKLKGKPVAVVFLAVHCSHSWDSLPILDNLTQKYKDEVTILPVFTNSGSVDDVRESTAHKKLGLDFLVAEGKKLSETYQSLIVPSTFLLDTEGKVTKRLVGFKDQEELEEELMVLADRKVTSKAMR